MIFLLNLSASTEYTKLERKIAMESLNLLNNKAKMCSNGIIQLAYISREEARSLNVSSEAIITTVVIDEKQIIDVIVLDIPNGFVKTYILLDGYNIIMNIRWKLVNIFL